MTAAQAQEKYLEDNAKFWSEPYFAPNVESHVFRFYGRILKPDFGITGQKKEKILDFGCGQGAALNYFHKLGFDAYGVDINESDLEIARKNYPQMAANLKRIDPKPQAGQKYFDAPFDVVMSGQTLYYLSNTDFAVCVQNLYDSLRPGGVFFATMMSDRSKLFFDNSEPAEDGMRVVNFSTNRYTASDYHVNFTNSEEELKKKFSLFEPLHIGFYSDQLRSDEAQVHHYTFVGVKK